MASKYPNRYDNFTPKRNALYDGDPNGDYIMAEDVNELQDAISAIEKTLGINPQGNKLTVNERITLLEGSSSLRVPSILIYLGSPSQINGALSLEDAVSEYVKYDYIVLGNNAEDPNNPDHTNSATIIDKIKKDRDIKVYGYIDCGVTTSNLSIAEIQVKIQAWKDMGVAGIYCGNFGFEKQVSRDRQNQILDSIHAQGLTAIVQAANPDEVFSDLYHETLNPNWTSPNIKEGDAYHFEKFVVDTSTTEKYLDFASTLQLLNKLYNYRQNLGIKIFATPLIQTNVDQQQAQTYYEYAHFAALLASVDAYYPVVEGYGASTNENRTYDWIPIVGNWYVLNPEIKVTGNVYSRKTSFGKLSIDNANHTYDYQGLFIPYELLRIQPNSIDGALLKDATVTDAKIQNYNGSRLIQAINASTSGDRINISKIVDITGSDIVGDIPASNMQANVITAINANIGHAQINGAVIGDLTADHIKSGTIDAERISGSVISAINMYTGHLEAGDAYIHGAAIDQLDAGSIKTGNISADRMTANVVNAINIGAQGANIQNLNANNITSGNIAADRMQANVVNAINMYAANMRAEDAKIDSAVISELTANHIKASVIDAINLSTSSAKINGAKIADASITSVQIAQGAVQTAQIADGSITDAKIVNLSANKINAGTINTAQVTIQGTNGKLKISGNRLQVFDNQQTPVERVSIGDVNNDGTVYGLRVRGVDGTTVLYDHNGVYSEGITNGAITNPKIADDAVDSRVIAANSIMGEHIVGGTITGDKIAAGTITANNIAANTITAASGIIADAAITDAKIANLDASKITSGYISAARIQAGSITGDKIAANTITASNIASGTITATEIASGTITATQIAAGSITGDRLSAGTITGDKIAAGTITGSKIASGTITASNIAAGTITANEIASGAITTSKIAAKAVTTDKLTISSNPNIMNDGYDSFEQLPLGPLNIYQSMNVTVKDVSNDYARDGGQSFKLAGAGTNYVNFAPNGSTFPIPVTAGNSYIVSAYAYNPSTTSVSFQVACITNDVSQTVFSSSAVNIVVSDGWVRNFVKFTAPAGATGAVVRVQTNGANLPVYFDAIQFEAVDPSQTEPSAFKPTGMTVIDGGNVATQIIAAQNLIIANRDGTFKVDQNGAVIKASSTIIESDAGGNLIEDWNASIADLKNRMSSVEVKVEPDAITNTVRSSTAYQQDLNSKANASDLLNYATKDELQLNYVTQAQLQQTSADITAKFEVGGGVNLIRNSIGLADFSFWETSGVTSDPTTTRIRPIRNSDITTRGFSSGFNFVNRGDQAKSLKQKITVMPDQKYMLSGLVQKMNTGASNTDLTIYVYDTDDTGTLLASFTYGSSSQYDYHKFELPFTAITNQVAIKLVAGIYTEAIVTGLMLNKGEVAFHWQMHPEEIYNTNIRMDLDGIRVSQIVADPVTGSNKVAGYTVMTPDKFAGYYDVDGNGVIDETDGSPDEVFRMDKDEFVMKKANVKQEITMGSIKVLYINSGGYNGWAFVAN